MKYTTIIWDMDGTVLDTLCDLCDSVNFALLKNGMPERTQDQTRRALGNGILSLMELSVPGGRDNPEFERVFADFKTHYAGNCRNKTCPYEGIPEVLDTFKAMGIKMAIVSNKINSAVDKLCRDFYPQMDYALGEVAGLARKPAPDMVEKALAVLGSEKSETVYIGDSEVDVLTAKNSGLDCISVLWGFRTREELVKNGASIFAELPCELIDIIKGTKQHEVL